MLAINGLNARLVQKSLAREERANVEHASDDICKYLAAISYGYIGHRIAHLTRDRNRLPSSYRQQLLLSLQRAAMTLDTLARAMEMEDPKPAPASSSKKVRLRLKRR
jgi:hypothetical protein